MNAGLTASQKALVKNYSRSLFNGAVACAKPSDFAATANFGQKAISVSFEGAFSMNYYMVPTNAVVGDMKLYVWSPEVYAAASRLTEANAVVVPMIAENSGRYYCQISGIAAKALDKTYYVAAIYTDANGIVRCTGIIPYSLSTYCMNKAVDGNAMQSLAAATAMYGYYAAQFFVNN
jgi:hypothetical protein